MYAALALRPITASDSVLVLNSAGLWKYATRDRYWPGDPPGPGRSCV